MLDSKVRNCYTCSLGATFMEYLSVIETGLDQFCGCIIFSHEFCDPGIGTSLETFSVNCSLGPNLASFNKMEKWSQANIPHMLIHRKLDSFRIASQKTM